VHYYQAAACCCRRCAVSRTLDHLLSTQSTWRGVSACIAPRVWRRSAVPSAVHRLLPWLSLRTPSPTALVVLIAAYTPRASFKPQGRNLDFGYINIRSLGNKLDSLLDVRRDKNIDVLFLAETWHDSDSVSIHRLRVELGCQAVDRPRPGARHDTLATNYGGVAAVAFHGIRLTQLDIGVKPTTFEFMCMRVAATTSSCVAAVLYRPGSECVTKMFFTECHDVMDRLAMFTEPSFLVGDLNIRLDCPSDPHACTFVDDLAS